MGKYNTRGASKRISRNIYGTKENTAGPDDDFLTSKETSKKRKATKTPVECEKEPKKYKKTNSSHDSYCWKCHKIETYCEILPEIECSTCPRSFHPSCIRASKIDKDKSCYICQQQSHVKTSSSIDDEYYLSELLLHIIDTACPMDSEKYKAIVDWPNSEENEKLFCKKDFRLIRDKCVQRGIQYESHVELVDDIEWIQHNCIIIYGEKSPIATSAKKILLEVKLMLKDASDCPECYYKKIGNEPLPFLYICKTPHPLVWAKVKGFSYWPAKCLNISNGKAHVRFFHTHQIGSVPLFNVLALSKDYPSKKQEKKNNLDFVMALAELQAYLDIFNDYYGAYPHERINTPFDFNKAKDALEKFLEKHPQKTIISEDAFPSLPVVDLTDDASENSDEETTHENVDPPLSENHVATTLFEQAMPSEEDFLNNIDNGNMSSTEPDDSAKIIIAGFQHSMDVLKGNPKEFQYIEAISGSLLPSQSPQTISTWITQRIPSPAGISISNVISGTDVSSGTDLLAGVTHCDTEPVMQNTNFAMSIPSTEPDPYQSTSVYSASSNSIQLCLKNYERTSEVGDFCDHPTTTSYHHDDPDIEIINEVSSSNAKEKMTIVDTDCILQTILRHDPNSLAMLKQANRMVQQFFIQFWGTTSKLPKPEHIIQSQVHEMNGLKTQLEELRREIFLLKNVTYEEKMRNADNIVQCLKAKISSEEEKYKKEKEKFKQEVEKLYKDIEKLREEVVELNKDKEKLKEEKEKLKEEKEKHAEAFRKELCKVEARFNERLKEAKTIQHCSLIDCFQPAKVRCCFSGIKSFAYCSEKCKAKDSIHQKFECQAGNSTVPLQQPEEQGNLTAEQVVVRGLLQQSMTTTTFIQQSQSFKEITSSSVSPQTSSANIHKINKVVSAKKTCEVSRNINRNQNSSEIY